MDLKQACKQIKSIITAADRVKEKRKNMDIVINIQHLLNNIDIQIAEPHRSFVYEGYVFIGVKEKLKRYMYLFSDMFLVLEKYKKKKKFELDFRINLRDVESIKNIENDRDKFKIVTKDSEYTFRSENKNSWISLFDATIKKLHSIPGEVEGMRVEDQDNDSEDDIKVGDFSRDYLMTMIIKWSEMKNPDQVIKEIKSLSKKIEHFRRLNSEETL